jgi:hypothetical protein
MKLGDE